MQIELTETKENNKVIIQSLTEESIVKSMTSVLQKLLNVTYQLIRPEFV